MPSPSAAFPEVLEPLRHAARLWRAGELSKTAGISTGYSALDAKLPGRGWPLGALTEIAPTCLGVGELSLALPALQSLTTAGRSICFVQPPCTPYAPALFRSGLPLDNVIWIKTDDDRNARWAAEELLREGKTGAVLLWSSTHDDRSLRRLQLAAETGSSLAFLYRAPSALSHSSPAALRIALRPLDDAVEVRIVKARGGHAGSTTLRLPWVAT